MTAIVFNRRPRFATIAPRLRKLGRWLANALDAFAEARMRAAVPEHYLRRVQRDMDRCDALFHPRVHGKAKAKVTGSIIAKIRDRCRFVIAQFFVVLAEVRLHKARLEAEVYRNRYRLRTKNDDDLPVVRCDSRMSRRTGD
jgi:hypothetical protein